MGSDSYFGVPGSNHINPVEWEEHAKVDGVSAKKVFPIQLNPLAQTNPSIALTYTNGLLTQVQKTIGSTTYTKTLTYNAQNLLSSVSVWS